MSDGKRSYRECVEARILEEQDRKKLILKKQDVLLQVWLNLDKRKYDSPMTYAKQVTRDILNYE
jgi:hypothetical protein